MLGVDTVIRTPEGERTIASLGPRAIIYDSHNREIEVEVGPPIQTDRPFEVEYYPLHHNEARAGRVGLTSIFVDGNHPLLLVAPTYVKAFVHAPAGFTIQKRAVWYTRCVVHDTLDNEIAEEALLLAQQSTNERGQRLAAQQAQPVFASSSPSAPSSDMSWRPDLDEDSEPEDANHEINVDSETESSDDENMAQAAPSSDDWLQDEDFSPYLMGRIRRRLEDDKACLCGGIRKSSLTSGNEAEALHLRDALRSHLYMHVDPQACLAGENHVLTAHQYVEAKHIEKSDSGAPVPGLYLKIWRFPMELLPAEGAPAADLPIEPHWLGLWYGDGRHNVPAIASAARDQTPMREKLQAYVNRLNAEKPDGIDPIHLAVSLIPANDSGSVVSRQDCYLFRISGSGRWGTNCNPYVDHMRDLNICRFRSGLSRRWTNHLKSFTTHCTQYAVLLAFEASSSTRSTPFSCWRPLT